MFQAHQQRNKQWLQGQSLKLGSCVGAVRAVPVSTSWRVSLYPVSAAVYLFFIRHKDSVFTSNQSQTTWQHDAEAFLCV